MEGLPEIVERLLEVRGIGAAERERFLNPSLADFADPEDLPGVGKAARVILGAVATNRKIVVFGDYDCDGVSATAILVKTLSALGARVSPFIPERLTEGYGMSDAAVARLLSEHPDVSLVVTVDNGINSVRQIATLNARGIGTVVTDHHLPGEELPHADALVDPKVAAPEALDALCGAGVAFLLANRLVTLAKERGIYSGPKIGGPLVVLAGLATVTDIMSLRNLDNRILVAEALKRFASDAPLGLNELYLRAARNASGQITAHDFGFLLGPRINAAGRLASATESLDLILETDRERVRERALQVDLRNTDRKAIEQRMTDEAAKQAAAHAGASAQVIDLPDGHPGVAGIVAAHLLENLDPPVPVCVYAGGHGSGRAPDGFNLRDAFVACDAVLERYGGHAAAGGFAIREGHTVDEFRTALAAYCDRVRTEAQASGAPAPKGDEPDLWIETGDVSLELAEALGRLEPFGVGFPEPLFGLRRVIFTDVRTMGADAKHLSVTIASSSRAARGGIRAVWWGHGERAETLRSALCAPHDITFNLIVSDYGERHVELRLHDIDGVRTEAR